MIQIMMAIAHKVSDGHLTIMKFTTNWRVSFSTPSSREDYNKFAEGSTFEEACVKCINKEIIANLRKETP